jgi:predicted DNA-binding protein
MKTLTLTLEPHLEQRLHDLAQRQGRSETEVVLEAIRAYTDPDLPDWIGIATSSEALSERDEAILRSEWQ